MSATPEQLEAIETSERALLVEAGAGTGKTWVLVQRFVRLLDQHPDWPLDSIVAITYTEKAAREMRTRVRQALERRAAERPADPLWQARRRELERLQVSTIHSLCARILRENAIAAELDPRFGVLDESQAGLLKEEAVQAALANLAGPDGENPALELLISLSVRDIREQAATLLGKRGTLERLFGELPDEQTLLSQWREGTAAMRAALWQEKLADPAFSEAMRELPLIQIMDPLDKLAPFVQNAQRGCALAGEGELLEACQAWASYVARGGKAAAWGGAPLMAELKEQLKLLRDTAKDWLDSGCMQEVGELDHQAAAALQQWKALWQAVADEYQRRKAAQAALDFDDLELLTAQLLARQPRPERLQAYLDGVNHLMVDEFQDTNQSQQGIVYALAHPSQGGRLFVVGDAKQSIYRFRQAQVAVFNRTAQDIERTTGRPPIPLSRSFRTHERLVNALNSLFEQVLQPLGSQPQEFEARMGKLRHQRPSLSDRPPVELILLPGTDSEDKKVVTDQARVFEARLLAEKLLALQAEGYLVWDREANAYRPFRFDDAAILFCATTAMPLYEEQFKAAGLPYLTVSGRGYYDRPEIRDLIALLKALYNPADDLNLAAALRSPLFNLSDDTLYLLRWYAPDPQGGPDQRSTAPIPYLQALGSPPATAQQAELAFALAVFDELRGMVGRAQVWRLLRAALDRTGLETALALNDREQGGGRQRSNLAKFMALARQDGGASLSGFLQTIDDLRASEAREGEGLANAPASGAVQLMSIHAAKGLEFPLVCLADLGREKRHGGSAPRILHDPAYGLVCMVRDEQGEWAVPVSFSWARWLDERMEEAEAKRLLYVACTRAADLLVCSGQAGNRESWMQTILGAWEVEADGAPEEVLRREGFDLRILRPPYQEQERARCRSSSVPPTPDLSAEMPAFARPLAGLSRVVPLPVTQLERLLADIGEEREDEEDAIQIRPGVRPGAVSGAPLPAYLAGRVIHRALADWECLELPELELARRIETYARREGIRTPQAIDWALRRCGRIIAGLRAAPLYAEICQARQRRAEIPFSLTLRGMPLHGVIDLLYQDRQGRWLLVDWKSERIPAAQLREHAERHALQVAVYAEAARQALGQTPQAAVCFLAAGARVWQYSRASLEQALQDLATAL